MILSLLYGPIFSYRIYLYRFAVIRGVPARRMKQIECLCETNPMDSTLFALCFEPCLLHACLYGHVMPIFVCFAPISMSCPRDHTTTELGTRSKKETSRVPVAIGCRVPRRVCEIEAFWSNEPNSSER